MEEKTFKQAMNRIDEIIQLLEKNEIELENAIEIFEEGLKLVNDCDSKLKNFESKMNELMNDYEEKVHD